MQISGDVKLHCRDHASYEFQENQQSKMRFDLLSVLSHGIRHALQHIGVLAGVHSGQNGAFNEWEIFHGEGLVQILFLDVLLDVLVGNWFAIDVGGAEEHSGGVVVFVVDDVHGVVSELVLIFFLLLCLLRSMQYYNFISFLGFSLFLRARWKSPYSLLAQGFREQQILFVLFEILAQIFGVG